MRDMSKFARTSKNCDKLEKSQFSLKLLNSSGKGCRRVSSKNCHFCNFCDFSKNCEKLEKSPLLLNLIKSSVTGGTRVSRKNCNISKSCEKLEKSQFLLKLIKSSVRGGARVPGKNCDFCNFSKNCKNHNQLCVSFSFTKLLSKPTTILELVVEIR